jgi:L-ascorbate metabolism protein UlaG (beta-lactamase superfamily)
MPSSADVTWLGHATVLVEAGGARILTDPVLGRRVAHLRRHATAPAPLAPVDAVLLSHLHRDHADARSLREVAAQDVPVIVPRGAASTVRRMGPRDVREIAAGGSVQIAEGVTVHAVPAVHDGRRSPLSRSSADTLGYVIEAGPRIWFAGDTALYDEMSALERPDLALLPIWGWGPTLGGGHMDPLDAARAAALVEPGLVVPIHWGTFLPLHTPHRTDVLVSPGADFVRHAADLAPGVRVELVAPGSTVRVESDD